METQSAANGYRILLVDPEHAVREVMRTLLHMEGYETDEAATLPEAMHYLEGNSYSLVLTDTLTRGLQPPPLLSVQPLQQRCHPIPVGVVTGWPVDPESVTREGFAFLLRKPFDLDELLQRIADSLNPAFTAEQAQQAQIIRRFLQALSAGDRETLRVLCAPTLCYYPLTRSVFTAERALIGFEAYLAYAQLVRSRLPDFWIDQVVIFQHQKGLLARYRTNWTGPDGTRRHFAGSALCRFTGERISQIGVAQPRTLVQALVG